MSKSTDTVPTLPPIPLNLIEAANVLVPYLNDPNISMGEKLRSIYDYLDQFSLFAKSFTTCSKGCSHCCRIDVHITSLEAEYIQVMTGIPYRPGRTVTKDHTSRCPFLSDVGGCGIYQHRPLACRIYHAVGVPDDCAPGRTQMQYGAPPQFGNPIYASFVRWLQFNMIHLGGNIRDIRDFFPPSISRV